MPKYKYQPKNMLLLSLHMNCNPDYIFEHAKIAGRLSSRHYKTYAEYVSDCNILCISHFGESLFNDFMETI